MQIPRNVRQTGNPDEMIKVYMEDYVFTYIRRIREQDKNQVSQIILLGNKEREEEKIYFFISGAILLEEECEREEKKYFPDLIEIGIACTEEMGRYRYNNIEGKEILLELLSDGSEELYYYQLGELKKIEGYFIYYERNEQMQIYMQTHLPGASLKEYSSNIDEITETDEIIEMEENNENRDVAGQFRMMLQQRQEEVHQKKVMTYLYMSSSFLVLIVFVIGITMMNNYDKMKDMERTLEIISEKLNDADTAQSITATNDYGSYEDIASPDEGVSREEAIIENKEINQETKEGEDSENTEMTEKNQEERMEDPVIIEKGTEENKYYIVEKGDTLAGICRKNYGNCDKLEQVCEINHIKNKNIILYGQKILLP